VRGSATERAYHPDAHHRLVHPGRPRSSLLRTGRPAPPRQSLGPPIGLRKPGLLRDEPADDLYAINAACQCATEGPHLVPLPWPTGVVPATVRRPWHEATGLVARFIDGRLVRSRHERQTTVLRAVRD
jgi:hypothetical protein